MTKRNSIEELYVEQLRELYSAEIQLVDALPELAQAAHDPKLKAEIRHHWKETYRHIERIEKIMEDLDRRPTGHKCDAMVGLIRDGKTMLRTEESVAAKDAALIEIAHRIERYEIASYGCVLIYAMLVGDEKVADTLKMTLHEEAEMDRKLTGAAGHLNVDCRGGSHLSLQPVSSRDGNHRGGG